MVYDARKRKGNTNFWITVILVVSALNIKGFSCKGLKLIKIFEARKVNVAVIPDLKNMYRGKMINKDTEDRMIIFSWVDQKKRAKGRAAVFEDKKWRSTIT